MCENPKIITQQSVNQGPFSMGAEGASAPMVFESVDDSIDAIKKILKNNYLQQALIFNVNSKW